MDDAQRRDIDALFDAALDHPTEQRSAFLDAECQDPEVRLAVERLLDASDDTASMLSEGNPWHGSLGDQMAKAMDLDPAATGERIGPWRIVRELGRGGMASVYLAKRADGHFEQQVALKLATTVAPDQDEVIRRFHLERQILASLDHPNIARLVDGGLTTGGRPYFAMELIDGSPLDEYCDRERLPIRERLRLMIDLARGVEAAHRALIVHRDLKPSNVLVTRGGVVKVLDFGIAKQVGDDFLGLTQTAGGLMTPEFASPEQFRGELVTTSSDVYQLGLLLYHLLVGERPYRLAGLSPTQAEQTVCDEAPERPSTRIGRLTRSRELEHVGKARQVRPGELRRMLAGDLDTLVMTALRKEPERRYRSAAELADDLESYLAGRPIRARGDSPLYLGRKFLQRHKIVVTAAAAALTLVVAVVAFYTHRLGLERDTARREAASAAIARDRAVVASREAERTAEFLVELFQQSDPWEGDEGEVSARDLLDRGAHKVRRELADQPTTQARLMDTIGKVYRRLALFEPAEALLTEAFELRQEHLRPGHPDLGDSLYNLAYLAHERGHLETSQELFHKALAIYRKHYGARSPEVVRTLTGLANNYRQQGRFDDAETLHEEVLEIERERLGDEHIEVATTLANLASVYHQQGRGEEAIELFQRVLAIERQQLGPGNIRLATSLNNLGMVYDRQGHEQKAIELYEESFAIKQEVLGQDHPSLAGSLINLASAYGYKEHVGRSEAMLLRAVALLEKKAPEHHWLGNAYTNLAGVALERDELENAEKYFDLAFENRLAALGPKHPEIGAAHYNFGELYLRQDRPADAAAAFERALTIWQDSLSPTHTYVGFGLTAAAEVSLRAGDLEKAEKQFARAHEILGEKVAPSHEMRRRASEGYAELLERIGREHEAVSVRQTLDEDG